MIQPAEVLLNRDGVYRMRIVWRFENGMGVVLLAQKAGSNKVYAARIRWRWAYEDLDDFMLVDSEELANPINLSNLIALLEWSKF